MKGRGGYIASKVCVCEGEGGLHCLKGVCVKGRGGYIALRYSPCPQVPMPDMQYFCLSCCCLVEFRPNMSRELPGIVGWCGISVAFDARVAGRHPLCWDRPACQTVRDRGVAMIPLPESGRTQDERMHKKSVAFNYQFVPGEGFAGSLTSDFVTFLHDTRLLWHAHAHV